jgi:hypothetical protein
LSFKINELCEIRQSRTPNYNEKASARKVVGAQSTAAEMPQGYHSAPSRMGAEP